MHLAPALLFAALVSVACARPPSGEQAAAALRVADPAAETTMVVQRVWADGPPWFACAEVIAKFRLAADSAHVRDQVGNWRPLLLAEWATLRDTAHGPVVDPGWCYLSLRDTRKPSWVPVAGDAIPSGGRRRGWDVPVGRRRIVVPEPPRLAGEDSATVSYALVVAPNDNGSALQADADSIRKRALLIKVDGAWRVASP